MGNCLSERINNQPVKGKHETVKSAIRPKRTKQCSQIDLMFMGPQSTGARQSHEVSMSEDEETFLGSHNTLEPATSTKQETSSTSMSIIGDEHVRSGNYGEALNCHREALALHKKESGGLQNEHTAKHYDKLGSVYHGTGAANRAASYYHKALTIRLNVHGEDHLSTADSYDKVGAAYAEQGDYAKALNFHHKAKHVKKKLFGRSHGNTARSFWNIGDVHYRKGDYDEALDYFNKAKEVQEKVISADHPDKTATQNSIDLTRKAKRSIES